MEAIIGQLATLYGRARFIPRFEALDELICCILSQSSSDVSSFPAFTRLRETFPDWQAVIDAGQERVADVIRKAGLGNQKARAIIGTLEGVHARFGDFSLDGLRALSDNEATDWLTSLPGVGPKTAAIVLCFGFGRDAIPVDTHVHRVAQRLGLIGPKVDANRAHALLREIVPRGEAFAFHTLMVQHGRHLCSARKPECPNCPLLPMCPYGQEHAPSQEAACAR